eukprot:m.305189 g.305189  ORF g.305189 m.305189 type:complete len:204 (+) comp16446_c4_seq39:706-1317(+)
MKISNLLHYLYQPDPEIVLYGAQLDIHKSLPELAKYLPATPLEAEQLGPAAKSGSETFYISASPVRSSLHYDSRENLVCLLTGNKGKEFFLVDPLTSSALLYGDQKQYGNGSPLTFKMDGTLVPDDMAEEKRYNLMKYVSSSRVTLYPGDCLYIPIFWYHQVFSLGYELTVSLNYWRTPNKGKKDDVGRLLCGRRHKSASMTC